MLNDVHRDHAADRTMLDPFEALRDPGERHIQSALLKIGHRSLVDVEPPGLDAGFLAGLQRLATSAADVENRLLIFGALDVVVDVDLAAKCIFETAIDEIGCRLSVAG